jgi:hypothetical protein
MGTEHHRSKISRQTSIDHASAAPPVAIPPGHVGPFVIPGTGRTVYWTGRVAIGLRHQPEHTFGPIGQSALWIQGLMLARPHGLATN